MTAEWIEDARGRLLGLRDPSGGWGYRPGTAPAVEPTSLACLGLLATDPGHGPASSRDAALASADWLASHQGPDGSLGVSAALPAPGWATPYAVMVWAALGVHADRRGRAARWMLTLKGETTPVDPRGPSGHNTSIVGWPWLAETHSWLEPTALAVLVLGREGLGDHPRVREGLRLIGDRAIAAGGWNYGNNVVFGRDLRPQPAPTGLALLALARSEHPGNIVGRACQYLRAALPAIRAASSLCWGLLGLRAWGPVPEAAGVWLAEAHAQAARHGDTAPRLAGLLLAAGGGRSLELLGVPAEERSGRDG